MASTALFAQEHHWTPVTSNETMSATSVVLIDGTEQDNPQLEIGVFCVEDGTCGSSCFPNTSPLFGHRIYSLAWYGQTGKNYTFKLYDHSLQKELDVTGPVIPFVNGQRLGNPRNPYQLTFTSNASGYTLEIDPYTSNKDNYYLIASPVGAVAANVVEGLRTPDFDFFSFDQEGDDEGKEWINLRDDEVYELQPGMGYLYANNTGTDLTFTGTPVATGNFDIELYKAENSDWPGWNLVGNPLAETAYVGREFYRMSRNEQGSELIEANGAIEAMEGVFVIAAENGEILTFTTTEPGKTAKLALNLIGTSTVIDRAVVNFGQGGQLPKFQINSNSTKLYIPMDDQDYAVVSCGEMGELPVNFKAERSGSYTIAVSSEEVSFGYLHLIDNLTGADVDLLANPSYSFDANTTDYASRFRLVFATGNADDTFAFFSNGSFVVSNEGEAMLQVVDVTGRILSSETINGCASVNIDAAPYIYMSRLANSYSTKVHKVVVR